jgi:leucyl-tRNA synthetase
MQRYNPSLIEPKWQKRWEDEKIFKADDQDNLRPKMYILDMFPYPSAAGLHVGHPEGYTASDILARYKKMCGFNVLHPMGWDAFGLPAENYAIKTGIHPKITTEKNIKIIRRQIKALGFSYDWSREINTTDPEYYKWTQWIFLKLFKQGLAYQAMVPINWCEKCKVGLANEEVQKGRCEFCKGIVIRKEMKQWLLRITRYADRLLKDLDELDWPESIKIMQRNWIGRSEGAEVFFELYSPRPDLKGEKISVFTTRADTIFGATYLVLAPEHPLVDKITSKERIKEVEKYISQAKTKSDLERTAFLQEKTGVWTGALAINPLSGQKMPIWISDYVLPSYGTGAIMAVPAHDERDFEFAKKFGLEIRWVVKPLDGELSQKKAFTEEGISINSGEFSGLKTAEFKKRIIEYMEKRGIGKKAVSYKLRDWVFSRQRYWGEPIPLVHCESCGVVPVPESELPLRLPDVEKYEPTGTGESPLANIQEWVNTPCPKCKAKAKRETNTMPQWAGSCWYYLRFIDPTNKERAWDPEKERKWMNVDVYIGGAEHAVLHLLYARFWYKVLYDLGYVSTKEPFKMLRNQGMILGEDGRKMSKSLGNVINPDEVIAKYGADVMRMYEMFMGPFEATCPWDTKGIEGINRFIHRLWNLLEMVDPTVSSEDLLKIRHQTIKKVQEDIENFRFNTAISALMIYVNEIYKKKTCPKEDLETLLKLISPFAPHIAEEMWEILGHKTFISLEKWPEYNKNLIQPEEVTIVVQVNGRVRYTFKTNFGIKKEEAIRMAYSSSNVQRYIKGKKVKREIFVPNRLINFVVE